MKSTSSCANFENGSEGKLQYCSVQWCAALSAQHLSNYTSPDWPAYSEIHCLCCQMQAHMAEEAHFSHVEAARTLMVQAELSV